jgi:hypothetical protein
MLRFLPLAFLTVAVADGAPLPKSKNAVWFPTREGDTRVYEVRVGDKAESSFTDKVTRVEKKDVGLDVTIARDGPGASSFVTVISVTREGLFRVMLDGEALTNPITLLKLPAKVGTRWELDGGATYTITQEEEIEVPAGKFPAVRVEMVRGSSKTLLWFAPNVGLVKMQTEGSERVQVLKEFRAGK